MSKHPLVVTGNRKIHFVDYDPASTAGMKSKKEAVARLEKAAQKIGRLQDILYAHKRHGVVIILHGPDAGGKSGATDHVMCHVHPAGCEVTSFKAPSAEELDHDYLWRCSKALPKRGHIGIFDRSYYEELSVVRVHPEVLAKQGLPQDMTPKKLWKARFKQIKNFERYLTDNGYVVLKFFLNLSKGEQKKRLLERLDDPNKNWKFSDNDIKERKFWDDYQRVNEEAINGTSTLEVPMHIIPADHKWVARALIAETIAQKLGSLKMQYPRMDKVVHQKNLEQFRKMLEEENGVNKK